MKPVFCWALWMIALSGFALAADSVVVPTCFYVECVANRGGKDHIMYLWRDGKKVRYERLMGTQMLKTFVDPEANRIVGLFDDVRQYVVVPYSRTISGSGSGELAFNVLFSEDAVFKPLGEEKVGDAVCMKYRVEANDEGGIWCWICRSSQVPVKLSDENGKHEVFWRNFSRNVSMSGLFSIPAGYSEKK